MCGQFSSHLCLIPMPVPFVKEAEFVSSCFAIKKIQNHKNKLTEIPSMTNHHQQYRRYLREDIASDDGSNSVLSTASKRS